MPGALSTGLWYSDSGSTQNSSMPNGPFVPGFNPLAQQDATLLKSLMAGEHCLHGFTNRDIRAQLASTRLLRSCADDPKKRQVPESAAVSGGYVPTD